MPQLGSMLAPQFSLRTVLIATAVCGVISLIGGAAVRGSAFAAALVMALAALVLMIAVHGIIFFAVWVCSQLFAGRGRGAHQRAAQGRAAHHRAAMLGSPFADSPISPPTDSAV
jgi:predicted lipid-binding transport protein (Tim44 family)